MPIEIKVPSVGESITEGTIARWLKNDGEQVQQDEPIFELETEKATQEIPAPAAGVLHIKVKPGEHVAIGSVVGMIDDKGAAKPTTKTAAPKAAAPAKTQTQPAMAGDGRSPARPNPELSPAARA